MSDIPDFRLELKNDAYWIVPHNPEIGPYDTKAEALEDLAGIKRFYRDNPLTPEERAIFDILT